MLSAAPLPTLTSPAVGVLVPWTCMESLFLTPWFTAFTNCTRCWKGALPLDFRNNDVKEWKGQWHLPKAKFWLMPFAQTAAHTLWLWSAKVSLCIKIHGKRHGKLKHTTSFFTAAQTSLLPSHARTELLGNCVFMTISIVPLQKAEAFGWDTKYLIQTIQCQRNSSKILTWGLQQALQIFLLLV